MATSVHGCLAILLLAALSIDFAKSLEQDLNDLLEPFHDLPQLHQGVVRDFEYLQDTLPFLQDDMNAIVEVRDMTSQRSIDRDPADRNLSWQNEIGFCYDALYLSDANGDGEVDGDEFVTFVQILGPGGFLSDVETFTELPLIMKSNFIILACLCLQIPGFDGGQGIDPQCCAVDPHISTAGTQPGVQPTQMEAQYLYQVCFLTETSIDRLLQSGAPTTEPASPQPTGEPTFKPTGEPTFTPTVSPTFKPTFSPTNKPTAEPTLEPTQEPTPGPTESPTPEPTPGPTASPTRKPTPGPTASPTPKPTPGPTESPTQKPTPSPTEKPTFEPTAEPTPCPSENPTPNPTSKPTFVPTPFPSIKPTPVPTVQDDNVTSVPTPEPVIREVAIVDYGIAVTNGKVEEILPLEYVPDLIASMDIVSSDVASSFSMTEVGGRFLRTGQRILAIVTTVILPTGIENREDVECPPFVPENDSCQTVTASIELNIAIDEDAPVTGRQDPSLVKDLYEDILNAAIEGGALQAALIGVNPNTVVTITTGFKTEAPSIAPTPILTPAPTRKPIVLSGGGIAGIVLAGIGGLIIGFLIIGAIRRRGDEDGDSDDEDGGVPATAAAPGAKLIPADDQSSAGESGWSSNQDGSSANTSMDASLDSVQPTNFSGIVLGDNLEEQMADTLEDTNLGQEQTAAQDAESQQPSQDTSVSGTTNTDGSLQSTYSELDEAIQKGDWAAVGVTAALLASQAYTDDGTQSTSKQSGAKVRRANSALNPERAAELDRLVETGDWEGVVAAAAKFDAQEALRGDARSSQNSEAGDSTAGGSSSALSGSGGESIGTSPSNVSENSTTSPSTNAGATATSDTASTRSKARKLSEIREEVYALVKSVVPEEADNVDEMMTQFRGREEELVETLRSMQERQVAQKARKESQKQAKRQAKEYMQEKKAQETLEAVDNTGNAADDAWMKELDDGPSSAEQKGMKAKLKAAIENEDWENVAETAAGLSGHPLSKTIQDIESVDSIDINELVDKGDWDGVIATASKYAESSTGDDADDDTIEQRRKRREERLREEEEALAQAEIWDAIADQTKGESGKGSKNSGAAKMAADWAIDQSLAALKKAEEDNDDDSTDSGQDKKGDNESL